MNRLSNLHRNTLIASVIISTLLILRLWLLDFLPLYDTTEARYAEIARIMFETSNWVTPQYDYHQPFWGKPPMHTWMSAFGFAALGVSEFAARLPHFICGVLVLLLVFRFLREYKSNESAVLGTLVLTTSFGFIIAMGMVMTDIALLFSTTLGMISFWKAYVNSDKIFHGNLFFVSLALGMLIKGPVAIVIVGIALLVWAMWQKKLVQGLAALPWTSGIMVFLLLTLPWYILAENRTPGFLEYFIVGEHFQRFLVSGWEGDLYGNAHNKPRGTIWLYWIIAAFPWSLLLIGKLIKHRHRLTKLRSKKKPENNLTAYMLSWMIAPLLLFTLAGNVLIAYVLPGFAAMVILVAIHSKLNRSSLFMASASLVAILAVPIAKHTDSIAKTSEVELLNGLPNQYAEHSLYYWKKRPFSARFYSLGQAQLVDNHEKLLELAYDPKGVFIAAELDQFKTLFPELEPTCKEKNRSKDRFLMFCQGAL